MSIPQGSAYTTSFLIPCINTLNVMNFSNVDLNIIIYMCTVGVNLLILILELNVAKLVPSPRYTSKVIIKL